MDVLVALLVHSLTFTSRVEASPVLPSAAAMLGGILAARGAWHVTDRLIAWRQRPEED